MKVATKIGILLLIVFSTACNDNNGGSEGALFCESSASGASLITVESIAADIEATGATVVIEEEHCCYDPTLGEDARGDREVNLIVDDEIITVIVYPSAEAAESAAARVAPDGLSIAQNNSTIIWDTDTTHFYRKENVIVLYIDTDASIATIPETSLGPQFAGG